MKSLTVFEETVLLAIYRLKDNAYSVMIHRKIKDMTGENIIIGSLYNGLDQLFNKGYLEKHKGDPSNERGGKSKMYYVISNVGLKALEKTRTRHEILWSDIPPILINKEIKG